MNDADALASRAEALQVEVAGLRQDVTRLVERTDGLRKDLTGLGDRQSRSEGHQAWFAIALVVVIAMAAAIGLTAWRVSGTDRRIDAVCPILALAIGGYDPNTRPEGPARDKYVASFDVMRQSYTDLACTQPLVPPKSGN
jgi:hypothetical protein